MTNVTFSHVALTCRDLDATAAFYTDYFGFTEVRTLTLPDTRIVFLQNGAAMLELFQGGDAVSRDADADGPRDVGTVRHLAFQVPDVDAHLLTMGEAATLTLGPLDFDTFIPGWRTAWIRDPDGVIVEISQGFSASTPTPPDALGTPS
jgi:Lactoylglutathione lyase and related lyases